MQRRQIILFAALFTLVVSILVLAYWAFLRPSYTVLYEDLREADAAAIVTELDKQGIAYRLGDNGHQIFVPESDADKARVVIAGSGIAMGGVVGFELFNEADMGLTEFAEKVNYQRALQGEFARTIMMMDGVTFARVHLSLPERTLFRAAKASPRAAVTIQMLAGRTLDAPQVEGIQHLVASAIADLPAQDVTVLDNRGDLVSPLAPAMEPGGAADERKALEAYFQARGYTAAARFLPGLPFELRVLAQGDDLYPPPTAPAPLPAPPLPATAPPSPIFTAAPRAADPAQGRNVSLRVALRTEADLNEENRTLLRQALTDALGLTPERGDVLRFETGPLGITGQAQWGDGSDSGGNSGRFPSGTAISEEARGAAVSPTSSVPFMQRDWVIGGLILIGLAALGMILLRRRKARMDDAEQEAFADLLSGHLAAQEGRQHG